MKLIKRLASLFSGGGAQSADKRYLTIYVHSRRCNEPISGQVDLLNELSRDEESGYAYYTRKVLHTSGDRRCFSEVEVQLYFNQNKQVVQHEVEGGHWLTSEEYAAELERFNAPPPEDEDENESEETAVTEANDGDAAESNPAASLSPEANAPTSPVPNPTAKENDNA
jgi:hypothetical protein